MMVILQLPPAASRLSHTSFVAFDHGPKKPPHVSLIRWHTGGFTLPSGFCVSYQPVGSTAATPCAPVAFGWTLALSKSKRAFRALNVSGSAAFRLECSAASRRSSKRQPPAQLMSSPWPPVASVQLGECELAGWSGEGGAWCEQECSDNKH